MARRLIALHDQTLAAIAGDRLAGRVRIGIVEDLSGDWLTALLARFSNSNPSVSVEIHSDRRAMMMDRFKSERLDLLLTLGETAPPEAQNLGSVPICWIGSDATNLASAHNVPLVLLDAPCMFRELALAAFAAAGRDCRLAFTSHSVSTQWSAVRAGLGVSLRTPIGLKWPLKVLQVGRFLPALPANPLFLLLFQATSPDNKPAKFLAGVLREMVLAAGFGECATALEAD
jgi:DNA-binding transcriptional LysR family regulator